MVAEAGKSRHAWRDTAPERYDRAALLARLLAVSGEELETTPDRLEANIARLARALRGERRRARAGERGYDLERHIALAQAHAGETALLKNRLAALRHQPVSTKNKSANYSGAERAGGTSACAGAGGRGPSSWRGPNGRRRNSAPPSGNRPAAPIFRGIPPATDRNACADGASGT